MFHMVWLLFGIVMVGTLLLMLPVESEPKVQPNGRDLQVPRVLRADQGSMGMMVAAIDLTAAAAFLMWPMTPFGAERAIYFVVLLLGAALAIAPVTCWLVRALDSASIAPKEVPTDE